MSATIGSWSGLAVQALARTDPRVAELAGAELSRQRRTLNLVAASSPTLPAALAAQGMLFGSVTAEGYAGARFHPGALVVDELERLARERAERAFTSPHANVQLLSGSAANLALLYGLLEPGDTVLSLDLSHGGHLSHVSAAASISRRVTADTYGVGPDGLVDHDALVKQVIVTRPRLLICGGSAYPRRIDFRAFRAAADEVGALLLADISHISGLVVAGEHPSPVPWCDLVTTSTYKQLCGPHGGLVLQGRASRVCAKAIDRAVFPGFQGTPDFGAIAAKAVALEFASRPEFAAAMRRVAAYARLFAQVLTAHGIPLVTGGTDTHMVLVNLRHSKVSGRVVSEVLEHLGVLANKNLVPEDPSPARETSGLRLGTNDLGFRPLSDTEVRALAEAIARVVAALSEGAKPQDIQETAIGRTVAEQVRDITARGYLDFWRT